MYKNILGKDFRPERNAARSLKIDFTQQKSKAKKSKKTQE
jgi:hypothetical protein